MLHLAGRDLPAFRNKTAISPPNKKAGKLNELRASRSWVKSSAAPQLGQITFGAAILGCNSTNSVSGCRSTGQTSASSGYCLPQYEQVLMVRRRLTSRAQPQPLAAGSAWNDDVQISCSGQNRKSSGCWLQRMVRQQNHDIASTGRHVYKEQDKLNWAGHNVRGNSPQHIPSIIVLFLLRVHRNYRVARPGNVGTNASVVTIDLINSLLIIRQIIMGQKIL